jgi:hypothetical protein
MNDLTRIINKMGVTMFNIVAKIGPLSIKAKNNVNN